MPDKPQMTLTDEEKLARGKALREAQTTDAEFIRALKDENLLRIQAICDKNERLERIARYLEEIDNKRLNDCGGYVP